MNKWNNDTVYYRCLCYVALSYKLIQKEFKNKFTFGDDPNKIKLKEKKVEEPCRWSTWNAGTVNYTVAFETIYQVTLQTLHFPNIYKISFCIKPYNT